jgi:inner membrane protein
MAARQVMAEAPYPVMAVASPIPIAFWERDVLWRTADGWYGTMRCTALSCVRYPRELKRTGMDDPRIPALAAKDPAARAFLFWSRMPVAEAGPKGILLSDQRFMNSPARGTFSVLLKPD